MDSVNLGVVIGPNLNRNLLDISQYMNKFVELMIINEKNKEGVEEPPPAPGPAAPPAPAPEPAADPAEAEAAAKRKKLAKRELPKLPTLASPEVEAALIEEPLESSNDVRLSTVIVAMLNQSGTLRMIPLTFFTRFPAVANLVAITKIDLSR